MHFVDAIPAIKEKFGELLRDQIDFFTNFQPVDPMLDAIFPGRKANIEFMRRLSKQYDAHRQNRAPMTAYRCLLTAREFMTPAV